MESHIPVMINQVIKALEIKPNGIYVDLTLGRGGHAKMILEHNPHGLLIGFDKDQDAIQESKKILQQINSHFILIHSDFKNLKIELDKKNIKAVDGILADLGVSSPQLDQPERGFSYSKLANLDMRMDQNQALNAQTVVNDWTTTEMTYIFKTYADVKLASRVANAIVKNRPIQTTIQLADLIRNALPAPVVRKKNVVRQIFQAIRIAVNDEINALNLLLEDAVSMLKPQGKLAIITFHSLEDRIVKKKFTHLSENKTGKLPIKEQRLYSFKTFKPQDSEILVNRRARSARLRVLTKLY